MKLKIYWAISVISLCAAISGIVFCVEKFSAETSLLFVYNVEALSQTESGQYVHCYDTIHADSTETVLYCGTCSVQPGRGWSGMNFCKP